MCHTLNDHWGIGQLDINYQSPKSIIEHLCSCRKVGANYLINIGPTAQGGVDPMQRELMRTLGKWMKLYGEAIYEGKPCPTEADNEKNFILKSDDYAYIFVHDLRIFGDANVTEDTGRRAGDITFRGFSDQLESVEWMDNGEQLDFSVEGDLLTVNATGYPYGLSTCVRVAKAKLKK
jgi:alpha-L-fucosidase